MYATLLIKKICINLLVYSTWIVNICWPSWFDLRFGINDNNGDGDDDDDDDHDDDDDDARELERMVTTNDDNCWGWHRFLTRD